MIEVKRALISVSDKSGIVEFAKGLTDFGIEIISTGGTFELLKNVQLNNCDFSRFLNSISFDDRKTPTETNESLIYCDPPYLETANNYQNGFSRDQSLELFDTLEETKCKYAMSEFDHPFIIDQAKQRNLNVIVIGERQNLKNRRTEILVTNYKDSQRKLDF